MINSSDQIRCSLVAEPEDLRYRIVNNFTPRTKYVLERMDGTPLDIIDTGQEAWKWKMPKKPFWDWKFLSHTPDIISKKMQRVVGQEAFNSLEKLIPQKIKYQKLNSIQTDFTIAFLDDIHTFDNKLTVLAHAYLYQKNSDKNGVIEFNDSPESKFYFTPLGQPVPAYLVDPINFKKGQTHSNGNLVMRASQPLLEILMHELRHATGERHYLLDEPSLMAPTVKRGWDSRTNKVIPTSFQWSNMDIKLLEEDFGTTNILMRHLNRWRSRRISKKMYDRYLIN